VVHFFLNYEYEREPQTFIYTTPYPRFNFDQTGTRASTSRRTVRLQFSPKMRLRCAATSGSTPFPTMRATPAWRQDSVIRVSLDRGMDQLFASLTDVIGTRAVNEVKLGYAGFNWNEQSYVKLAEPPRRLRVGAPSIQLRGLTLGETHNQTPQKIGQELYSFATTSRCRTTPEAATT